jgi:N-dimethylarginine dimethylaminohydrolase
MQDHPLILMCAPEHFEVSYSINPWMKPTDWAQRRQELEIRSGAGWRRLHDTLEGLGAETILLRPQPGLPDLVFTANAAVVLDGVALPARFRHPERQGEEAPVERFFERLVREGVLDRVAPPPPGVRLEGAGDCVWDASRQLFWLGYGQRSDPAAAGVVRQVFDQEVMALQLVDPRFYHMDTCLSPLPRGEVMIVPEAFSPEGLDIIRERVPAGQLIALAPEDAANLAANAIVLGDDIVLSECSPTLRRQLAERGYWVHEVSIPEFALSGGSCFCLTLRLDRSSGAPRPARLPLRRAS